MKEYVKAIEGDLALKISKITGIDEAKIRNQGIQFCLENPRAIEGVTRTQAKKLELLKALISQYNETMFVREEKSLNSSAKSGEYFLTRLRGVRDREYLEIAFLNAQNNLIATNRMFEGSIDEAPIYPREIIKEVLNHNAKSIIVAHNHPGGTLQPSGADIEMTRRVGTALDTIGVKLLDHIIVAGDRYISLKEKMII
jgi:DNA repair protein RadC